MKSFFAFILMFLGLATSNTGQLSPVVIQEIDSEIQALMEDRQTVGLSIAIVDKNEILYSRGFGYKNVETKDPVTENTLFAIGSCTKAFTAALLGKLEDEGTLSLMDSPRKHVPYLSFYNDEMNNQITIQDIMCHRTGLPRHDLAWYLFPTESKKELVERIAHQEPTKGVRETWQYNNFMYLVQGVIAEELTGKTWEENIEESFFRPLGMNNSVSYLPEDYSNLDKSLGYTLDDDQIEHLPDYRIQGMSPAGSIYSSANDMGKWAQCWLNLGKVGEKQVIPEAYARQAVRSQMVINPGLPSKKNPDQYFGNYGYGWMMASYKGHYRVMHGGNIDGFSALTTMFPTDSLGIIVLDNQNGSSVPGIASRIIADKILGLEYDGWEKRKKDPEEEEDKVEQESVQVQGTSLSHKLEDYTGKYSHPGYGTAHIMNSGDSLFVETSYDKFYLGHFHYDVFSPFEIAEDGSIDLEDESPLKFNFRTSDAGKISGFEIAAEAGLDPIRFEREPDVVDVEKKDLEKFVGAYTLGAMEAKIYLKGESMKLFVPGQPEYTLLPIGKNKFSIEGLSGFDLLFEEIDGKIVAVSFHQPNGIFKAEKKQ